MTQASNITIRPMQAGEKKTVHGIMRQSFPLIQQWFFSWTPNVLVAERDGQLLGATVLKLFPLPGGRKGGLVYWVFTAPEARGLGLGQRLVEAALRFFEEQGCDEIMACVEGFNTSSNKLFATRGFSILSPGQQFRRYGNRVFSVWVSAFHFIDIGHFLWARPAAERPDSPTLQWWGSVVANALIALLALWRGSGFHGFDPLACLALPLMVIFFFGLRDLAMRFSARRYGLALRYRAWESGLPLSLAIALGAGRLFPMPGAVYPASDRWRYHDLLPRLGSIALAGALPALALTWGAWALSRFGALPPGIEAWLDFAMFVGKPLALFDIALPFFPFASFNGRRIWDRNRVVWAVLAVAAVAVFFVA
ncbi:MAG: GNAT family N-acetyltransferase [Anaerolineales bacterium]|nr:GNAT family N-acetyltransferase [Anaerolineales bacterium]